MCGVGAQAPVRPDDEPVPALGGNGRVGLVIGGSTDRKRDRIDQAACLIQTQAVDVGRGDGGVPVIRPNHEEVGPIPGRGGRGFRVRHGAHLEVGRCYQGAHGVNRRAIDVREGRAWVIAKILPNNDCITPVRSHCGGALSAQSRRNGHAIGVGNRTVPQHACAIDCGLEIVGGAAAVILPDNQEVAADGSSGGIELCVGGVRDHEAVGVQHQAVRPDTRSQDVIAADVITFPYDQEVRTVGCDGGVVVRVGARANRNAVGVQQNPVAGDASGVNIRMVVEAAIAVILPGHQIVRPQCGNRRRVLVVGRSTDRESVGGGNRAVGRHHRAVDAR